MKRIKEYYITIIVVAMTVVVNIGAFASYVSNIKSSLAKQTSLHVEDIMDDLVVAINLKLDETVNTINTMAATVSSMNIHGADDNFIYNILQDRKEKSGYSVLELVGADGTGLVTGDSYAGKDYFEDAMKGKTVIREEAQGKTIPDMAVAAPVYAEDGETVELALIAVMDVNTFSEKIGISSMNQNGKVLVVRRDGTLLSRTEGLANANSINDIFPEKTYEDKLLSSMRSRDSGTINYEGTTRRYIGYSRLSYNKWYVISIISSGAVEAGADDVETDVLVLGIELGFILLVLFIYLVYNVAGIKKRERMNLERYFIAAKYADIIMLDYSVVKDTMYCNDKWKKTFGYSLPTTGVKEGIKKYIFGEDIEKFEENTKKMTDSGGRVRFRARMLDKDGRPLECIIKMFPIYEKKGKLTKVMALIESEENRQ